MNADEVHDAITAVVDTAEVLADRPTTQPHERNRLRHVARRATEAASTVRAGRGAPMPAMSYVRGLIDEAADVLPARYVGNLTTALEWGHRDA